MLELELLEFVRLVEGREGEELLGVAELLEGSDLFDSNEDERLKPVLV